MDESDIQKRIKEFKVRWVEFRRFIGRRPTNAWLTALSTVEVEGAVGHLPTDYQPGHKGAAGIRAALADAAIRFSNNHRGKADVSLDDIDHAKSLWLGSDWKVLQSLVDGDHFFGLSGLGNEQFAHKNNHAHLLGRARLLYAPFLGEIERLCGMPFERFLSVGLTLNAARFPPGGPQFSLHAAANNELEWMTAETVRKFLDVFSAGYALYRQSVGTAGVRNEDRYGFRPIIRYPVIETSKDRFIIPVEVYLFRALSDGFYYILLDSRPSKKEKETFHSDFGMAFETYIRHLFSTAGFQLQDCTSSPRLQGPRCEFIIEDRSTVLGVEAKKFAFLRDTFNKNDPQQFDMALGKLAEAFFQIENTLKQVPSNKTKAGLIVTFGMIPFANAPDILERIRKYAPAKYPTTAPDYIRLVDIEEIEMLTALAVERFWEVINQYLDKPIGERGNLRNTLIEEYAQYEFKNAELLRVYRKIFEDGTGRAWPLSR